MSKYVDNKVPNGFYPAVENQDVEISTSMIDTFEMMSMILIRMILLVTLRK